MDEVPGTTAVIERRAVGAILLTPGREMLLIRI